MTAHTICRDGVAVGSAEDAEVALKIARDYKAEFPSDLVTVVLDSEDHYLAEAHLADHREGLHDERGRKFCRACRVEAARPEAIARFRTAFESFYTAGMDLVAAWDDRDAEFNADELWPLPPSLVFPLSLDEYLMELREHYLREEESEMCPTCGRPEDAPSANCQNHPEDEIHDRIIEG